MLISKLLGSAITVLSVAIGSCAHAQTCPKCPEAPWVPPTCEVMEGFHVIEGCVASVTAAWGEWCSAPTRYGNCIATIPSYLALEDYQVEVEKMNNASYSVDRIAAGTQFEYSKQIQDAYKVALELAAKAGNTKLEAKIKDDYERAYKEAIKYESNLQTVQTRIEATPDGSCVDRKRSYIAVHTKLRVRCIAPLNLEEQLRRRYGL